MSTTTSEKQRTKRAKKASMEEAIEQLVELANGYASYADKIISSIDNCLSIKREDIYVWVSFVNDVWFVSLGNVEVTTNAHRITFPYNYTINDLVKTCTFYTSYLDKLNTDLSKRTEDETESAKSEEIARLKSKLAELGSGEVQPESCPF